MTTTIVSETKQSVQAPHVAGRTEKQTALRPVRLSRVRFYLPEVFIVSPTLSGAIQYELEIAPDGTVIYYLCSKIPFVVYKKHRNPIGKPAFAAQYSTCGKFGCYAIVSLFGTEYADIEVVR